MTLILPDRPQADPVRDLLTELLRGQFPTDSPDRQVAKADAIASVILAALKKRHLRVIDERDISTARQVVTFRDSEVAKRSARTGADAKEVQRQITMDGMMRCMNLAASIAGQEGLVTVVAESDEGDDDPERRLNITLSMYQPGYWERKTAQQAQSRLAATGAQIAAAVKAGRIARA